jgi:cytoskeletal protein RodZ
MFPSSNNDSFPELLTNNPALETNSSSEGMFSSWGVPIFIILLLIGLGYIGYMYLAKASQTTTDVIRPFLVYILSLFNNDTSQDTDATTDDNTETTPTSTSTSTATPTSMPTTTPTPNTAPTSIASPSTATATNLNPASSQSPTPDNAQNTALNRALNISKQQELPSQDYVANDSYSSVQQGKAGWCYIGSEEGYRSCSQVGEADTCMSGSIFPTQDICVNPNLRA